nr:hypothetical protein [Bacillus licheniformis]
MARTAPHTARPPKEKALDIIEDKTNTKLKLIWVPDSTKEERINTTLASGNMPKVMTLPDLEDSAVVSAAALGNVLGNRTVFQRLSEFKKT